MAYKIAAILLAAGMSKRAGPVNKLLAPIDGVAMVKQCLDVVMRSACDPVLVVTGHEAPRIEAALNRSGISFVHNDTYAEGMASSIRRGINALADDVDGVVIVLGDMPHIQPQTYEALFKAFALDQGHQIYVPVQGGARGNPVLFGRRFFADLEQLKGDKGGKPVMEKNTTDVFEVPVNDPGIHRDHDVVSELS